MTRGGVIARLCRGLGNPIRLEILHQLGLGRCSVGEIVENLRLEQSRVSKHLAVLRDVGLVRCDVDGRRRCYNLVQPGVTLEILSLLKQMQDAISKK